MTASRARCALGVLLAALALGLAAPTANAAETTRARWLMGTLFTLRAPGDEPRVVATLEAALDTVAALESRLSNWRESSDVSRLNAAGGGAVPGVLAAVVDSALALAELTGGAFDPTVEPLVRAWDLRGDGRMPAEPVLAAARARVDWRRVRRTSDLASGEPRVDLQGTALDLGGIGKGFALDLAADVLLARGVASALLDAGGQQLSLGAAPCSAWVSHPERRERPAVQLAFRGGSLSTSSQSERFVRAAGRRVGHVLDPRTGQPLATRASVTVWAASGTRADALSTALLVMGRERALAFAESHPDVGVLWIEPTPRGVRADSRNLDIVAVAPGISFASKTSHAL